MGLYKTGITNSTRGTSPANLSSNFQFQINELKNQTVAAATVWFFNSFI